MGDLFKKNWKKLTGVRVDAVPLSQCELARLKDGSGSGVGGSGTVGLAGDLSGTSDAAVVDGLQTRPVAATAPASGEVLAWNGAAWEPATPAAGGGSSIGSEFRVDLPGDASLAGKIAAATLPAGWTIFLGDDVGLDPEVIAAATDIGIVHSEGSFAAQLEILSLRTSGAAALQGYQIITNGGSPISKSNNAGTQFTVLGFTGLVTMTDDHRLYVKMLPTP